MGVLGSLQLLLFPSQLLLQAQLALLQRGDRGKEFLVLSLEGRDGGSERVDGLSDLLVVRGECELELLYLVLGLLETDHQLRLFALVLLLLSPLLT